MTHSLPPDALPTEAIPPAPPKTSRLSIASLVCGIAGPCTLGLGSIVGLVLGIVGLVKIRKGGEALRGQNMAIAGIVVSGVGLALLPFILGILGAILIPAIAGARSQANAVVALNSAHQLCIATHTYAASHGDKVPPPDSWPQVLSSQCGLAEKMLASPSEPQAGRMFAMNALLRDVALTSVRRPGETVLYFECAPGAPPAGGPELLPPGQRFRNGYIIAFVDGHVEQVPREEVGRLNWDPGG